MNENVKILLGAPQHISKMYAYNQWLENIRNFTFEGFDMLLADNSPTNENCEYIKSTGVNCVWVEPVKGETIFERIARSHNVIREYAIKNGYTHLFHLESDVIPPIDIIDRLLIHEKPVVSAYYDIYMGENRRAMIMIIDDEHKGITSYRSPSYIDEQEAMFLDGSCKTVFQCGLGCVLIRIDVLEMLPFRVPKGEMQSSADTWWYNDLFGNNIPVFLDTSIHCEHNNMSWEQHDMTN
jgi:hypothetical protein